MLRLWEKLSCYPFGKFIFNQLLGWKAPYSGSISPNVIELNAGKVRVQMKDRRKVRNHLNSIHAIALMNLGEVSSGLAVLSTLPENVQAIVTHLEIDFFKKARGLLTASAEFKDSTAPILEQTKFQVEAVIENSSKEIVARVKAHWLVGPKKKT